jgi:hypothetical protein
MWKSTISGKERHQTCYGKGVNEGVSVMTGAVGEGVTLGVLVNVDVEINVEVNDGVIEGVAVRDGVKVKLGVLVIGWNNVGDELAVIVGDGVDVGVGVFVAVPVMIDGSGVSVGL